MSNKINSFECLLVTRSANVSDARELLLALYVREKEGGRSREIKKMKTMKNRIIWRGDKILPPQFFILLKSNGHSDTFLLWHVLPAGDPVILRTRRRLGHVSGLPSAPGYPSTCCISAVQSVSPFALAVSREPNDPHTSNYGPASSAARDPRISAASIRRRTFRYLVHLIRLPALEVPAW